ncbi:MAG: dihydropteroate synthase [Candidatus Eremiobacteraeota bacterium]|nr:dihydropteroate synthase [Candidatus Eremiobacteraeota bacterium]
MLPYRAPCDRGELAVRAGRFVWGARTYVMAIVNVTPDSFSGDGRPETNAAVAYALDQWAARADLLDIGGESTRPGHRPVDASTELARVVPVVRAIRERLPDVPLSIDTYKADIVRAAHAAGADIVNSVWGVSDALLDAAAELQMPIVATHNQDGTDYGGRGVVDAVLAFLDDCATRAILRGVARESVVLDPGIGFGKTADQNIAVLRELSRIVALGFPTLLGVSRKSTIGKLTGREPGDRVYGSVAATAFAVNAGIDVVRVHDVAAARDCVAVADAIVRDWRPDGWIG